MKDYNVLLLEKHDMQLYFLCSPDYSWQKTSTVMKH